MRTRVRTSPSHTLITSSLYLHLLGLLGLMGVQHTRPSRGTQTGPLTLPERLAVAAEVSVSRLYSSCSGPRWLQIGYNRKSGQRVLCGRTLYSSRQDGFAAGRERRETLVLFPAVKTVKSCHEFSGMPMAHHVRCLRSFAAVCEGVVDQATITALCTSTQRCLETERRQTRSRNQEKSGRIDQNPFLSTSISISIFLWLAALPPSSKVPPLRLGLAGPGSRGRPRTMSGLADPLAGPFVSSTPESTFRRKLAFPRFSFRPVGTSSAREQPSDERGRADFLKKGFCQSQVCVIGGAEANTVEETA